LLHDIIEDVPEEYSKEQMRKDFGENVVKIVEGVTKDDSLEKLEGRSDAYLKHLRGAGKRRIRFGKLCRQNPQFNVYFGRLQRAWRRTVDRFNSGKSDQLWWYKSVLDVVKKRLPDLVLVKDFENLIQKLEKALIT
jgi:hypothetical protein